LLLLHVSEMKEAVTLSLLLLSATLLAPAAAAIRTTAGEPNDEEAAANRITSLPGYPHDELPSRHYSGYVRVGGGSEGEGEGEGEGEAAPGARNLFYYLVESEGDPARDPVVLWLNGGPGCSSFDAFIYEHGPFLFSPSSDGGASGLPTLAPNPFSWSKVATVIYLDSPGNVGLSYVEEGESMNKPGVFSTNDTATARDSEAFLRALLGEHHPRFLGNNLLVTGESYAGKYVPMLAREVVRGNKAGKQPRINIVGYAVGNGCTDAQYDGNALPPFLAGRGLLPQDEYAALSSACNGSYWDAGGGWASSGAVVVTGRSKADDECGRRLDRSMRVLKGINVYDVLDLCHASHRPRADGESLLRRPWAAATPGAPPSFSFSPDARVAALQPSARVSASSSSFSHSSSPTLLGHDPPCTSSSLADAWLNDDRVRQALHASPVGEPGGAGRWTLCSDRLDYTQDAGSMLPVHAELLPGLPGWPAMLGRAGMHREAGLAAAAAASAAAADARGGLGGRGRSNKALRALIYSGDHDAAVPSTGSEAWTRDIGGGKPLRGRGWRRWTVEGGTDAGGRPAGGEDAAGELASPSRSQVAGFTVDYEGGLTYATVRGAGHMVPASKPLEALELFRRFVQGEELAPPEKEEEEEEEGEERRRPSASSATF
jgi:serine carboxypeptidase-like clade I